MLNTALVDWKLVRLVSVVRAALRMGVGEMLKDEVAPAIVICEAVNLTDALMDETSASFVNGVLDTCKQTIAQPAIHLNPTRHSRLSFAHKGYAQAGKNTG